MAQQMIRSLLALLVVATGLVLVGSTPATALGVADQQFFSYQGSADTSYVTPVNACGLYVSMFGGFGGGPNSNSNAPGRGGYVVALIPVGAAEAVKPGDRLSVSVGASGNAGSWGGAAGGSGGTGQRANGFAGGGATSISDGATLIAVAGGGGGAGGGFTDPTYEPSMGAGGSGGIIGSTLDNGGIGQSAGASRFEIVDRPAGGGTQSEGGLGAHLFASAARDGGNGASFPAAGGSGANGNEVMGTSTGGGGGGGGYFGGGGGATGLDSRVAPPGGFSTGGAGGSSYVIPGAEPDLSIRWSTSGIPLAGLATITPYSCQTVSITPVSHDRLRVGQTFAPPTTSDVGEPVTTTVDPASTNVCAVEGGVVAMIGSGTCTMTAKAPTFDTVASASASYSIEVLPGAQSISLTGSNFNPLVIGQNRTMSATLGHADTAAVISVDSSDGNICTTDASLTVYAHGAGTCHLTFSTLQTANFLDASTSVDLPIVTSGTRGIDISGTSLTPLRVGGGRTVSATQVPASPSSGLNTASSDTSICTIDGSLWISAVAAGTCTITLTADPVGSYGGASISFSIQILAAGDGVQALDLSGNDRTNWENGTNRMVTATSNALGATFLFSSLTPSVCAPIADGASQFTAKAVGTCTARIHASATTDYFAASATVSFSIVPGDPLLDHCNSACVIPFAAQAANLSVLTLGNADLGYDPVLNTMSSGKLSATSSTPNVCTVKKGKITTVTLGYCTLDVTQAATSQWKASGHLVTTFAVAAAALPVLMPPILHSGKKYTGSFSLVGCDIPSFSSTNCTVPIPAKALGKIKNSVGIAPDWLSKPVMAKLQGTVFTVSFKVPNGIGTGPVDGYYVVRVFSSSGPQVWCYSTFSWVIVD